MRQSRLGQPHPYPKLTEELFLFIAFPLHYVLPQNQSHILRMLYPCFRLLTPASQMTTMFESFARLFTRCSKYRPITCRVAISLGFSDISSWTKLRGSISRNQRTNRAFAPLNAMRVERRT